MQKQFTYRPPLPSRATRDVMKASTASSRGFLPLYLPAVKWFRQVFYESIPEKHFLLQTWLRPDFHDVWEQPPAVPFVNERGKRTHHTFDFLVTLSGGEKIAVAIKPWVKVQQYNFKHTLRLVKAQLPKGFADDVALITERQLNRAQSAKAQLKLAQQMSLMQEAC